MELLIQKIQTLVSHIEMFDSILTTFCDLIRLRFVKLWNELQGDIVEADSFLHFKSKLKLLYLNI